jgi:DNA transformation protein
MFGLVADDVLYLKADAETRPRFEAEGCEPFVYAARGKRVALSYWRAPADALDAAHLMRPWARLAMEAALRAANAPGKARRPRPRASAKGHKSLRHV